MILNGFAIIFLPGYLFLCFLGVLLGTPVGVFPGLGPTTAIALLIPPTFHSNPVSAIITLTGIYYGGHVRRVHGIDSGQHPRGSGFGHDLPGWIPNGPALGIAASGSYIAGTFSIVGLMFSAPLLAKAALAFWPPEYLSL